MDDMAIIIENQFEESSRNVKNVKIGYRTAAGNGWQSLDAKPLNGNYNSSPQLFTDTIELIAKEIDTKGTDKEGPITQFGKITVNWDAIPSTTEWKEGNEMGGGILVKGEYNIRTKITTIKVIPFGPLKKSISGTPTDVNVTIGPH